MYDINTIEELIDELGGSSELARQLDLSQSAVAQWKVRGHISDGWHMRLFADVKRRGKSVAPEVFGMTEDEFAPLAATKHRSSSRALAS